MYRTGSAIFCLLLGLPWSAVAAAASFPCEKAQTRIEKAICADAEVSTLDEYLGRYYQAARTTLRNSATCLVADQRQWLNSVRNPCPDAACLKKVYLERLGELHALQPGATSLRNVALPPVPALVWIVPPGLDQVAAPVNKQDKPLVAQGAILNEVSGGDGYVLRARDGKRTLIVPLMFLESPTTDILASLAKLGGEYEVRGYSEAGSGGSTHFAPSRCVFVYRTTR